MEKMRNNIPLFSYSSESRRMEKNAHYSPSVFLLVRGVKDGQNDVMAISTGMRGHIIMMLVSIMVNVFY